MANIDHEYEIVTDRKLKMSKMLKANLDFENLRVDNNWDSAILVTGAEGTGKSTLAGLVGYFNGFSKYTNTSNLSLKWIVFTMEQFEEAARVAEPGQVIIWDEFVLAGLSTDVLTRMQKKLTKIFTTYRYKKLKYILIMPSIWMLGWYFATHRTSCLIHCFSPDGLQRGYFRFYNRPEKSNLFFSGQKFKTYRQANYSFEGRYGVTSLKEMGIDVKEYEKKKAQAAESLLDDDDTPNKYSWAIYKLIKYIRNIDDKISLKEIVEKADMGLQYGTIRNMLSRLKDKEEDIELEQAKKKQNNFKMPWELKKEAIEN